MIENNFNEYFYTRDMEMLNEYLYTDKLKFKHPNVDFSEYIEKNQHNFDVITIYTYYRCLIEQDEAFKNHVIDDILYEIDQFGYYANEEMENALYSLDAIIQENILTPDDGELYESLALISENVYKKNHGHNKKKGLRGTEWKKKNESL